MTEDRREESSPCETLQVIVARKAVCSIDRRELTESKPTLHHLRCNLPAVAMRSPPTPYIDVLFFCLILNTANI